MTPLDIPEPGEPEETSKPLLGGGYYSEMNVTTHPTLGKHRSGDSRNYGVSSLSEVLHNPNIGRDPTATSTRHNIEEILARDVGIDVLPRAPPIEIRHASAQEYHPGDEEREGGHEITPDIISESNHGPLLPFPRMSRPPSPDRNIPPTTIATGTANYQGGAGKRARSHSFSLNHLDFMSTSTKTRVDKHRKHESGPPLMLSVERSTRSLTPLLNSSRSSFGSDGSSYHSISWEDGKEDHVRALFANIEGEPPEWHDLTDIGIDLACVPDDPEDASSRSMAKQEELVRQLSGLRKGDFAAIQRKLLDAARQRADRGGGGGGNASIRLPLPGLGVSMGQFSSPNSPITDNDRLEQQASTKVQRVAAVRKMLFDFPAPPVVRRKADRARTPSPTLGPGQRSRKSSGTINTEPSQIGGASSRGSSRCSVIVFSLESHLRLLSRFQTSPALTNNSRLAHDERDKMRPSFLALLFTFVPFPFKIGPRHALMTSNQVCSTILLSVK